MTDRSLCGPAVVFLLVAWILAAPIAIAGDWPMWRHDPGRTATSPEKIPALEDLAPLWSRQLPEPAPAYSDVRLGFDAGYEPIILGKRLIVGSNRDDRVTAFDTDTGAQLWKFYTDGPVRFAPVGGEGRILFGSDDGCVYCLKASDGSLVWKHRAVPSRRLVLGNGRLISVWPVRGGPVLHGGMVYFAAGVWPLEGTFVFCLKADTGEVVWRNDEVSYLYDIHPHNAEAYGGLAPQGYLLVDGEDLIVPSSQAYPARFDLKTGKLKEFKLPSAGRLPGGWFASTPSEKEALKLKRRGLLHDSDVNQKPHEDKLRTDGLPEIRSTVRVGEVEINFAEKLLGMDDIHSVVAGDGKLFASTKAGRLLAFGQTGGAPVSTRIWEPGHRSLEHPDNIQALLPWESVPQEGYALILGEVESAQIEALVLKTRLNIVGINGDVSRIASLRELGWDGHPVSFMGAKPSGVELPPYLAHLIVVGETLELTPETLHRYYETLRPFGGAMVGRAPEFKKLAEATKLPGASIVTDKEGWTMVRREGALEGATNYSGDWAANSDKRVKAPLGVLWYGDSITHFKRSPQPKFIDGVMISSPKDWTDASTRKGGVDYRLLETVLSDVYTGRILTGEEEPHIRKNYVESDRETVQPSQYRPPRQKDDWKPEAPVVGERVNPLTGETEPRAFPKSYGCDGGVDYGLMFSMRSGTPAFYDKRVESGTINISGPRSGCTNSIIPANGILNLPYFYEGCTCSYPLPVALALVSRPQQFEQWASWGKVEAGKLAGKIQRIGLNFGAPGDRMTEDGTLWLDVPNVGGPSPEVTVATEPPLEKLETFYQHSLFLEGGTGWPWVAGSGVVGLRSVTVEGMKPGSYEVRLTNTETGNRLRAATLEFELQKFEAGKDGKLVVTIPEGVESVCGIEIIADGILLDPAFRW